MTGEVVIGSASMSHRDSLPTQQRKILLEVNIQRQLFPESFQGRKLPNHAGPDNIRSLFTIREYVLSPEELDSFNNENTIRKHNPRAHWELFILIAGKGK